MRLKYGMRGHMNDKLEPVHCGCGGEAKIRQKYLMGNLPDVYVICENCATRTGEYYSELEAVEAWNRAMGADAYKTKATERTAKVDWINGEPFCPMCGDRLEWE